jgi:hypothetical protein
MSGANQPTVSVTGSTEGRPEDSVSQKPSSQGGPHTPNPTVHVPEQSNSQELLATDVLVVDWDGPNDSMRVVARWLNERNIRVLSVKSVKKLEGVLG